MVPIDVIHLKDQKRGWLKWYSLTKQTKQTIRGDGTNGTHLQNRLNRTIAWMVQIELIDYIC